MVEPFYTRFRFQVTEVGDRSCIGIAHFEQTKTWYPSTAIVKTFYDREDGRREMELTARCADLHSNVVQIYAFYETDQSFVMFLEHCQHGSVYDFLLKPGAARQTQAFLLPMMVDVASAVAAMHEHNLVHRDIKPHNVFVTRNCVCKLGDFETVKEVVQASMAVSIPKGTVSYMSPEKLKRLMTSKGADADRAFAEDVWALGKTFFEMCIGSVDINLSARCADAPSLHTHLTQSLQSNGYSASLSNLIYRMLTCEEQPSSLEVCSRLTAIMTGPVHSQVRGKRAHQPRCQLCKEVTNIVQLTCGHKYCSLHLLQHISSKLTDSRTLRDVTCIHCTVPISPDIIASKESQLPAELTGKLHKLSLLSADVYCVCKRQYPIVQWGGDRPRPYLYDCPQCKEKFCSWCTAKNGHKSLLGRGGKCSQFPFYND